MLTLIAVAIVVMAVFTLSHSHRSGSATQRSAGSCRLALIQTLGVLRRPQTTADLRALRPGALPGFLRLATRACRNRVRLPVSAEKLDRSLVRRVRCQAWATRSDSCRLLPSRRASSPRAARVWRSLCTDVGSTWRPQLADAAALRAHGLVLSGNVGDGINRGVMVVPDGVASVRLRAFRLPSQPSADTRGIASTNTPVHANVTCSKSAT